MRFRFRKGDTEFTVDDDTVADDEPADVQLGFEIAKRSDEDQTVFGWFYVAEDGGVPTSDHSGWNVTLGEIEKAAYQFNVEFREGGDMHEQPGAVAKGGTAVLIESFVSTPEKLVAMGLDPDAMPHGWWGGLHVENPDQWDLVKRGHRPMFSIQGKAEKEPAA